MPNIDESTFTKLNSLIQSLDAATNKKDMLKLGLSISDEIMRILGVPSSDLDSGDDQLDKALPNARFRNQKMEGWFEKHPYLGTARIALWHYNKGTYPIESMFYMLSDSPRKEKIAATTHLFPHWEDNDLTMIPKYKVGIDFFLSPKTRSLFVVISKRSNLRVMELGEHLTNTQREILAKCANIAAYDGLDPKTRKPIQYEPQRTIHNTLWNAFELKEVNKKFYVGIADHFQLLCQYLKKHPPIGTEKEIGESCKIFSSRLIGRLLFIWFLKKKGIINSKMEYFSPELLSATEYYEKKLKPLFFNTLNTPVEARETGWDLKTPYLNGGLFEPHQNDWADKSIAFPEDWFVTLYQHLNQFNFTTDESSTDYEQVAVDPEMLGRVFENLLATIVPETSEISERSEKGAFYTPREIVDFMCKASLKEYLKRKAESEKDFDGIDLLIDMSDSDFMLRKSTGSSDIWGARSKIVNQKTIESLNKLRILDPACGSGAFPIGMLQLLLKTYERLNAFYDVSLKTMRPIKPTERNNIYDTKLFIISNCLYGVDIEPMAIEIARLRAWLSLIIDDKKDVDPLPNLDFHFVCANTLVPLETPTKRSLFFDIDDYNDKFDELRQKYFDTHGTQEKKELRKAFEDLYRSLDGMDIIADKTISRRIKQLMTWNPFDASHPAGFFDIETMFNIHAFDLIIGNPPYVQLQSMKKESHNLYSQLGYSTYTATGDMYCLFIERGVSLLKPHGVLSFIVSNKWMRAAYGKKTRAFLAAKNPVLLLDFGGTKVFDSATVDTNIILVSNEPNSKKTLFCEFGADEGKGSLNNLSELIKRTSNFQAFTNDDPWTSMPPIVESITKKVRAKGNPLSDWNVSINYGIKTGANDAFIIDEETKNRLIEEDPSSAELIRPILRGKDISRYVTPTTSMYLIGTFPSKNIDIEQYPSIKKWLMSFGIKRLEQTGKVYNINGQEVKARKRTGNKWFETQDQISYWEDFSKPKLFYREIGPRMDACYVEEEVYINNKCYVVTGDHLKFLYGFINSLFFEKVYLKNANLTGGKGKDFMGPLYIPIPNNVEEEEMNRLVEIADNKLCSDNERQDASAKIELLIYQICGLSEGEIAFLEDK